MSYPFIIWTMHRSGSTSLADLLMEMSEHKTAEHEPFNWGPGKDRQFASVTHAWNKTKDRAALRRAVSELLAQKYLIKHCYQMFAMPFNRGIMEAAAPTEYRHVLLHRRDELSRMVSQFVAESTGGWAKGAHASRVFDKVKKGERAIPPLPIDQFVERFMRARDRTANIRKMMVDFEVPHYEVRYEDLYLGEREPRLAQLKKLLAFLDFAPDILERHSQAVEAKVFDNALNTISVAPLVPNLADVIAALTARGVQLPPSALTHGERHYEAAG